MPSLTERAAKWTTRIALSDAAGEHSYQELTSASDRVAAFLLDGEADLNEARVAYYVKPSFEYVAVQWGIWKAGGIAVPLRVGDPVELHQYRIRDSEASIVVADDDAHGQLSQAASNGLRILRTQEVMASNDAAPLPGLSPDRWAMMLYTSGTTSSPKGVVTSHANIEAQVESLVEAWRWSEDDRIPLFLPLDHIHGIINVLSCALWSGARCDILERFDAANAWAVLRDTPYTLFMAVPDIYSRLIAHWDAQPEVEQASLSDACGKLRLMVSGSSALPVPRMEKWQEISGHRLLERYGMTEIGMALSNPYDGERKAGYVGQPLPGVSVRIVDEYGAEVGPGESGEIQVKGANVFEEYWNRSIVRHQSFAPDGWFRTGDSGVVEDGYYKILGRMSQDIIKSGGEKVSALEVEPVVSRHPAVEECAVVGVADPQWGEAVSVAVVLKRGQAVTMEEIREFCRPHLTRAAIPRRLVIVDELPKNNMRKVLKPAVRRLFEPLPE